MRQVKDTPGCENKNQDGGWETKFQARDRYGTCSTELGFDGGCSGGGGCWLDLQEASFLERTDCTC